MRAKGDAAPGQIVGEVDGRFSRFAGRSDEDFFIGGRDFEDGLDEREMAQKSTGLT